MRREIMRQHRLFVPILFLTGLSACSTVQVGRNFDLHAFESRVQRGETSQAQVRGWLGEPASVGEAVDTNGQRFDEWTYYYGTGQLPDMENARLKILQIKFDRSGLVRGYNWSGEIK
jgi:outer membrane protein assembly factor BamE (lipoprotein component of BamABCDE complex)